jgi:hypothetical protein
VNKNRVIHSGANAQRSPDYITLSGRKRPPWNDHFSFFSVLGFELRASQLLVSALPLTHTSTYISIAEWKGDGDVDSLRC